MGIFKRLRRSASRTRYKIRIITEDGDELFWHKRGQIHVVDEDVAKVFVANFKRELFQVLPDGSLQPPQPGKTKPIEKIEMVKV